MKLLIAIILIGLNVSAAIPPVFQAQDKKAGVYHDRGVIVGGFLQNRLTLKKVSRVQLKDIERIKLEVASESPLLNIEGPGYFQVSLDPSSKRLVVDLEEVGTNSVNKHFLKSIFRKSPFISHLELLTDRSRFSSNLAFNLRKPVQVEVIHSKKISAQRAYIYIDLVAIK